MLRCRGKSYLDLLAQRAGDCEGAPDAVVRPADTTRSPPCCACARRGRRGRAVRRRHERGRRAGGLARGFAGVISLDLGRMDALESVDERSLTAVLGPGIRLPEAERALGEHGLRSRTCRRASSGRRSAAASPPARRASPRPATGASTRTSSRCTARRPSASWPRSAPCSAAGPALRELVVGSEGALGVITRVALRVRPVAEGHRHEGWFARSFAEGGDALRRLEQEGLAPDVARLSDETETRVALALAGPGPGAARRQAATRALGYGGGCLVVLGWEGSSARSAPAAGPRRASCARPGCCTPARRRGEAWAQPASRAAPARRSPRPRRAGRDARDRDELERRRGAARRGEPGAGGRARARDRRLPRLAPVSDRRLAVLHRARRPRPRRPGRPVGARPSAPPATRSRPTARRSRTTTRSAATTCRGWRPSTAGSASSSLRALKERCDSRRGDEPGRARRALLVS